MLALPALAYNLQIFKILTCHMTLSITIFNGWNNLMKKSITFLLDSNGNEVKKVREKTSEFLKLHGVADEAIKKQMMIVKELVKTCVQYSGFKSPQQKMTVQLHIHKDKITAEVSNSINGIQKKKLEKLDKTIQFIRGYQDPFEAYLKLKAISGNGSNELALAKLACEGKTIIDFFVSEDNIMNMSAVGTIN
jgi:hypothetical protein